MSSLGQPNEIKIASWNVNGLRSALKKGFGDWLAAGSFNVVMLQEVKADAAAVPELGELMRLHGLKSSHWATAKKAGYSGCLTLIDRDPDDVVIGLGKTAYDEEGRWLEVRLGSWVFINSYFPNSQRDHARLPYKLEYCQDALSRLEFLRKQGNSVLLAGDINIAHTEIDLANPKSNRDNAGFLPEERQWLDHFVSVGWIDVFRHFESGGGHYTWWSYRPGVRERNIGWRLDHMFVNSEALRGVKKMWHQPEIKGSDHCPIAAIVNS